MSQVRNSLISAKRWALSGADRVIVREWAKLYHRRMESTWLNTRWMGVRTVKLPADLWIYQEILFEVKPDLVIETGTMNGGSAYYMATLFDLFGKGRVVTIDIDDQGWDIDIVGPRPIHPRITYVTGASTDPAIVSSVTEGLADDAVVMVILDSDHSRDHVLNELNTWARFVTSGSYLIVEDGNINGHPVLNDYGPGPTEALEVWLPRHPEFEADSGREKFMHTFNPGGFLRRR